ncbi:aromatic acid exporter family protein [Pseudonocardia hispaniensis]|uniref:Aromatic acid exporter family protein n=1 Tax=Pseudonocardia hispaniensis TaxID=904933 RepID=A0ABW1J574_9PSEU
MPIVQCAVSAGLAWWVAANVVGHHQPFFAPIAAVISLGVSLGQRLRRAVELVVGVSLGVLVGDLLISVIGSGPWQIALVVALAMAAAVFADGGTLIVAQAAASAVLVATLLPPGSVGGLDRCVDALIGGVVGVVVAAVLPVNPVRPVRRATRAVLDELSAVLHSIADALRDRDVAIAAAALHQGRQSQPLIDAMHTALASGREVTTVAPLRRPRRRELDEFDELVERIDYAMRNARVLARRVHTALGDRNSTVDGLADAVAALGDVVHKLVGELGEGGDRSRVRAPVLEIVHELPTPTGQGVPALSPTEHVLVAQLRSIALDLLQASGMSRDEALAAMRSRD